MNADRIVNLVGASGSGKTALAKELDKLGYHIIHSYTNRPPRYDNEWGHTFIDKFINLNSPNVSFIHKGMMKVEKFIAYFNNYEKHEHYFATENQYKGKGTSIYIVDPIGAEQVKEIVTDVEVITIHLAADEQVRDARLLTSRDKNEVPARLVKDRRIFKHVPCDFTVDANQELLDVLEDTLLILQKEDMG